MQRNSQLATEVAAVLWKLAVSNRKANAKAEEGNSNKQHQASSKGRFTTHILYENPDSHYS